MTNLKDHLRCAEHQEMAISCSKIEEMYELINSMNSKIDHLTVQLSVLSTQKSERWKIQGWFNKGLVGMMITVIIAVKFYGGN